MNVYRPMIIQSIIFLTLGWIIGYMTFFLVPSQALADLFKLLGVLIAVSGSLLGWTAGWLDQSRKLLKDIDYDKAPFVLSDLAFAQNRLIWRWGIALGSAILTVVTSVMLNNTVIWVFYVNIAWILSVGFLSVSLFTLISLFRSLLASADIRAKLEKFELDENRRTRLEAPSQVGSNLLENRDGAGLRDFS